MLGRLRITKTSLILLALGASLLGCTPEAMDEQRAIRETHMPNCLGWMRSDINRLREGVGVAGRRFGPLFVVEDGETRARRLRNAIGGVLTPPGAMPQFFPSPLSFVAAVNTDGVVITRESDTERMVGLNIGERFEVVQAALRGETGIGTGSFTDDEARSLTILAAAPAMHEGEVVGAIVAGIPLWRMGARLTEEMKTSRRDEVTQGLIVWTYFYEGDHYYHRETPDDLDAVLPSAAARADGLSASPGGYTGWFRMLGRAYGYGVVPIPYLGEDAGILIVRANP